MKANPLLLTFDNQESGYSVVVEDDGRVAYAYLKKDGEIVGDVWLYNHGAPPVEPEWRDKTKMPFTNSVDYVRNVIFAPLEDHREVNVEWNYTDPLTANIYLRGELHARLVPNAMPGWSRLALKDGPLAKAL